MSEVDPESVIDPRYVLDDMADHGSAMVRAFGHDGETGREIFVKIRDPEEDGASARTRNEAEVLASVQHPQIPRLIKADPDAEYPYIIMQRMPGGVGPIRLLEQHADHRLATLLIVQALGALQATHDAGFSHGDVKENNFVVPEVGRPALVDFELARSLSDRSGVECGIDIFDPDQVRGTGSFMAPEQFREQRYDRVLSDVYAMGVTAGVLLYGERPYKGMDRTAVIRDKTSPSPVGWPETDREVPQVLSRVIDKATRTDPAQRHGTAAEMALDLEASLYLLT